MTAVNSNPLFPPSQTPTADRYAVIAGNGQFPFLVLEGAQAQGITPLVVAIREEASSDLNAAAQDVRWLSLGEVMKCLEILSQERVTHVVLAGQVKHVQIFGGFSADRLVSRTMEGLNTRNTDAIIGAFVRMLEARGMKVVDSTLFLKPLLPEAGVLTQRSPDATEREDIVFGRQMAKAVAGLDIGQTIVVADRACVAVEAMEGTDATIERAGGLSNGRRLVVVKVSKPRQDMRFDVPVVGARTIEVMRNANASVLAIDAGKTLLFERRRLIEDADRARIAVVAVAGDTEATPAGGSECAVP
jgi:UDP-2,3-diacylglucosamine hydrolase